MRTFAKTILVTLIAMSLAGCSNTLSDIKEAASGINSKANEAATAIGQDVHSIRAIEIEHNDKTFTVNDLFKNILRDVQWHYEKNDETNILRVTGTWQPTLFEGLNFDPTPYKTLAEHGEVEFTLHVDEQAIISEEMKTTLHYEGQEIFSKKGEKLLQYLFDYYTNG